MATNLTTVDDDNGFALKRSVGSGFVSDIDPVAKGLLDDLNGLLSQAIFKPEPAAHVADAEEEAIAKYAIKHPDKAVQAAILDTYNHARSTSVALEAAFDKAPL